MKRRMRVKKTIYAWIAVDESDDDRDNDGHGCAWVGTYKPNMEDGLLKRADEKHFEVLSEQHGWSPAEFIKPGTAAVLKITVEVDNDRVGVKGKKLKAQEAPPNPAPQPRIEPETQ